MRIFSNVTEAFKEIERDMVEMGILVRPETYQDQEIKDDDKFLTKELQGYSYSITQHGNLNAQLKTLGVNMEYLLQENLDRVSPVHLNPGNAWEQRPEIWREFLHKGKFSYTYNERMRTQLVSLYDELIKNPNTRQAIVTVYDHHQDQQHWGGIARIPCSMYYQILLRTSQGNRKLDLIYTMRSCDLYTHFLYDVGLAMKFQLYLACMLNLPTGRFTHFIGSLHAYKKDYETKGIF